MQKNIVLVLIIALLLGIENPINAQLTLYSGRSKALVEPVIELFEKESGIKVNVRYGGTTQLAVAIMEEGKRSPADVFWSQDAGALAALSGKQLLSTLSPANSNLVDHQYRGTNGDWLATSGRARVLAYSNKIKQSELPECIFDLTDSKWKGRIGWAPANASFQSFLSAMIEQHGASGAREWVRNMKQNGAVSYINNNALIEAIAAGEIDLAITNHYYLFRFKAANANYPVEQIFFNDGDIGNLLNLSGVAILKTSRKKKEAEQFVRFMLSERAQTYFATEVYEYPVTKLPAHLSRFSIQAEQHRFPDLKPESSNDLERTLQLLRQEGLL